MDSAYETNIKHWKKCDVNNLAANFNRLPSGGSQYERLSQVYLPEDHVEKLFPKATEANPSPVESIAIRFALDAAMPNNAEFNFRPIISVKHTGITTPLPIEFPFSFERKQTEPGPQAVVPHQFRDVINQNWIELDISLMDDVFTAALPDNCSGKNGAVIEETRRVPKRLLAYIFKNGPKEEDRVNVGFLKFINENSGNIKELVLYLGADMNKYGHKDKFTFSPIIEVILKTTAGARRTQFFESAHANGIRTIGAQNDLDKGYAYFEYMAPCPSTCGNENV